MEEQDKGSSKPGAGGSGDGKGPSPVQNAATTPKPDQAPKGPVSDADFPDDEFPDDGYPEGATALNEPAEESEYTLGEAPGTRRGAWVLTAIGLLLLGAFLFALLYNFSGKDTPTDEGDGLAPSGPVATGSAGAPVPAATKAKEPLTEISQVKVIVLNATKKPGLARTVGGILGKEGFLVTKVANADKPLPSGTAVIEYGPTGKVQAAEVARRFPGATLKQTKQPDATVTVLVGPDFTNVADPYNDKPAS